MTARVLIIVVLSFATVLLTLREATMVQHIWSSVEVGPVFRCAIDGLCEKPDVPQDVDELVSGPPAPQSSKRDPDDGYDVIVVGSARSKVAAPAVPEPRGDEGWHPPAIYWDPPATYFVIDVERVLLDDGRLAAGHPLVVRSWDSANLVGERSLYFLEASSELPEVLTVLQSPIARLDLSGSSVRYSDDPRSPVGYARGLTPGAFIDQVADAVQRRYGSGS